jgi:voltage-gated potassium channel
MHGLVAVAVVMALSVVGYLILTDATFLDALFMVVITIFSVGYEETIRVDTPVLKGYTVGVIVLGCSALLYVVGSFVQLLTEGEINRALGARRMTIGIESLRDHVIICGYGRMGQILARELSDSKVDFVVIDNSEERIAEAKEHDLLVLHADATEEETLQTARVDQARCLATVLPSDAMNVFIALSGRNLNPDLYILARGEVPATEAKLIQAGANHVVLPAAIGGLRMAHMIVRPSASRLIDTLENAMAINDDLDQLGVCLSEITIEPGSIFGGKTIGEVEVEGEGAFLIVAIRRADGSVTRQPGGDTVVHANDTVILIGHGEGVTKLTLAKTPAREIYG